MSLPGPHQVEIVERDVPAAMRDGVVLRADVRHPAGEDPTPALLYRAPYDKRRMAALDVLPAAAAVEAGYTVVLQDSRGRFASDGEWQPIMWRQEALDTYDTVEWIAGQPWCDGNIGMVGPSYLGIVQWVGAMQQPPHLRAIAPAMCTVGDYDARATGGALRLDQLVSWAVVLMAPDWLRRRLAAGDPPPRKTVETIAEYAQHPRRAMERLPLTDVLDLEEFPPLLRDVLAGRVEVPDARIDRVRIPTLSVSGWYDLYSNATIGLHQDMAARDGHHHLIMGCWAHLGSLLSVQGEVNFGPAAAAHFGGLPEMHLAFFDRYLRDEGERLPRVRYFLMGAREWRSARRWPPPEAVNRRWYLRHGGTLGPPPQDDEPTAHYRYDPADPVPTHGGRVLNLGDLVPGPLAQNHLEQRPDVLSYTSDALPEAVDLAGPAWLVLSAESSAPDTDFTGKLLDVHPDGRALLVADGIVRARHREGMDAERPLEPGTVHEFFLDLGHTAWRLEPGHRLRVHVSSSNFPQFDRNLNTGGPVGEESVPVVAEQTVHHSAGHPSWLDVTVLPTPPSETEGGAEPA
ncbi:CocE/NonD family hydrolase [Streptomyces sp. HC44]|uniref:CocE/NonD family hydrolase n=1 Tax=Streptomyces scabichelini TaxID=2711217 RepID=A0A6G4VCQ0_9ACTN|nr:CocE/NonD family hydrolase [Streptomyces scabichelini]NGO11583.1 CocE/NonD family hydrolase [Streptomyces scabichelini]